MPDISKIKLPSGTEYSLKDEVARQAAAGGIQLKGTTTTALTDEATTNPIKIGGQNYTAQNQDAVFYGKKEFVFDGTMWHEFGDMSGLGALAKKDSATASYKPAGTVSQPTFTGNEMESTGDYAPSGGVSKPTFTGTKGNVSVKGTPAGSVSAPTLTVTPSTVSKYVAASASGGGAVTAGTAAQCTMPQLAVSVENEVLSLGWTDGSFTPNTPTAVTLPSFSKQTIATGISSATATMPTFTGEEMTATGEFTPQGDVSKPEFVGDLATLKVKGTPSGTVTKPTFSGTQATITAS